MDEQASSITTTMEDECAENGDGDKTGPTVEGIREAQRVARELVWLLTQYCPDLMYAPPVLWKSSKQVVLLQIMEGAAMANAIRVVADELRGAIFALHKHRG